MGNVIVKPLLTEKSTAITEKLNKYTFLVNTKANKVEIKKEIEKAYGVAVVGVNTVNHSGKAKSRMTKTAILTGKTNATKKAIVTIAEGEVLDIYANI